MTGPAPSSLVATGERIVTCAHWSFGALTASYLAAVMPFALDTAWSDERENVRVERMPAVQLAPSVPGLQNRRSRAAS